MKALCVYGGQYGSEGKGCVTDFLLSNREGRSVVFGENAPNSGHTCLAGAVRSIPSGAFYADLVVLGPDAVVDPAILEKDWQAVQTYRESHGLRAPRCLIHGNAALSDALCAQQEEADNLRERIGSTCTGGGAARCRKYLHREPASVISSRKDRLPDGIEVIDRDRYMSLVQREIASSFDLCVFECSQGILLDINFGRYPYVTSRSTLPQAVLGRNGLLGWHWNYVGVYRTYPIRVGGNSGPTGREETTWPALGVAAEHGTVTRRERRVFEWSCADFAFSLDLCLPDTLMLTHMDYITSNRAEWIRTHVRPHFTGCVFASNKPGNFIYTYSISGRINYPEP